MKQSARFSGARCQNYGDKPVLHYRWVMAERISVDSCVRMSHLGQMFKAWLHSAGLLLVSKASFDTHQGRVKGMLREP